MQPRDRKIEVMFSDYSKYMKEGFLITPNAYQGEFDSIGELRIDVAPAISRQTIGEGYYASSSFAYEVINEEELISTAVTVAKGKGANAITNFKIEVVDTYKYSKLYGTNVPDYYYCITGFCIKIK